MSFGKRWIYSTFINKIESNEYGIPKAFFLKCNNEHPSLIKGF